MNNNNNMQLFKLFLQIEVGAKEEDTVLVGRTDMLEE